MKIKRILICLLSMTLGILFGLIVPKIIKNSNKTFFNKIYGRVKLLDGSMPSKKDLNKDYFFIYYGADWCSYCKESRNDIIEFYTTYKEKYNNFEIILAGTKKDKSNEDLVKYMKNENFPFYYVDYELRDEVGLFELPEYTECEKFYIPAFILVNREGKVLSRSNGLKKEDYSEFRPFEYYKKLEDRKDIIIGNSA